MQFCVTASSSSCEMRPLRDMENVGLIANLNSLHVSVRLWSSFSLFGLFSELRSLVARAPSLRRGMVMHTSIAEDPTSFYGLRRAYIFETNRSNGSLTCGCRSHSTGRVSTDNEFTGDGEECDFLYATAAKGAPVENSISSDDVSTEWARTKK